MRFAPLVKFARVFVPSFVACALLASTARAADTDNPEFKAWSAYKVGTTVKRHQSVSTAGTKQEMEMTTKLVELAADKAVVEDSVAMNVNGQVMNLPGNKRTIPAKLSGPAVVPPAVPNAPKVDAKEGEETVEAGGKSYKCKTVETAMKGPQGETSSKIWTSTDVPGGLVKMTSQTNGAAKSEVTMTLVSIDAAK